jgi:CDP-paratose 2-epimerase
MEVAPIKPDLGIGQWFHYADHASVRRTVRLMRQLGLRHLRTGISWADWHRSGGRRWYQWQMEQLAEFEVLLSIWHTPPSIAEGGVCAGPPKRLADFADFVAQAIDLYGEYFDYLELWNEPNNRYKWAFPRFDPDWRKFGEMIRLAARVAKSRDKPTVLGGMIPVDHSWLDLMKSHGALDDVDVIAIHGFPEMWWSDHPNWDWKSHWFGWNRKVAYIAEHSEGRPIWITETGLATWDLYGQREDRYQLQSQMLKWAAMAPVEKVYWYSLIDLDPRREAIEGFHVDENEYHLGLVRYDGSYKPAVGELRRLLRQSSEVS